MEPINQRAKKVMDTLTEGVDSEVSDMENLKRKQQTVRTGTIKCEHCEREYTEAEYNALEVIGHNVVWNFDYRRCAECGNETAQVELHEHAKIKTN